jgi:hypothetical protein
MPDLRPRPDEALAEAAKLCSWWQHRVEGVELLSVEAQSRIRIEREGPYAPGLPPRGEYS